MRVSLLAAYIFASALVAAAPVAANAADAAAITHVSPDKADHPIVDDEPTVGDKPKPKPKAAPVPAAPILTPDTDAQTPLLLPLRWTTEFPEAIKAGSYLNLAWEGGSPEYGFEVYYIPRWPMQRVYDLVPIENTTSRHAIWSVPQYDDFPEGTTFIFGVKDATGGPGGNWYDLTAPLPLVYSAPDARGFEAAIKAKRA
ncbi:hypothetical protein CC85DRAFT_286984 [Cutaneotrichosporon oleaginosum]|uniref:Fibronectin type-III domain-containing protein n=1 Tax=Cutaneotrichosporon oleaginosum TaxID=879819 RepID=A0A0J0XIC8_9TREE|nr:uncharacterized protein CC85DRAFT_286984 [Cutaneotrichosporon oleaginosum]KLT40838.1 hypothetical protein CC85DRAFT_286984 [Cutaneotrichosporon oleaginosum]TXT09302.1 hypothetical protein COLE_03236 [Cutaneotrichosporon oleaginosum]